MTHQVFISHSAKNKAVADTILEKLEGAGVGCWIAPRDIQPGDSWGGAILRAIGACKILVVILSENSNASHQVLREVERAVQKNVTIIPFRIEEITPSDDLEYFLSTTHWLDAYGGDFERHLQELVTTATNILAQHGITPSLSTPPVSSASKTPPTPTEISSSQPEEPAAEPELGPLTADQDNDTTTIDIPTIGPTGPGDNQDSETQEAEAPDIKEQTSPAAESPAVAPKQRLEPTLGVAKQRNKGNKQRFEPSLTASPEESTPPVEELDSHESATLDALETLEEALEETLTPGDATGADGEAEIITEPDPAVDLEADDDASFEHSSHQQDENARADEETTELSDVSESADTGHASEELAHRPADEHTATKSVPVMLIGLLLLGLAGAGWYFTQGKPTSSTVQETAASDSTPSSNNQAQNQGDVGSSSAVAENSETATAAGTGTGSVADTGTSTESSTADGEAPTEQNSDTPAATSSETTTDEVAELTPEEAQALEQAAAQAAEEAAKQRAAEEARRQAIAAAKADFDSIAQQAEGGDVEAVLALAVLYERGNLAVKADPQAALELYRQASDAGNAAGQYAVAQNLLKDGAQSTDVPQAIELLDAAAAQSHVPALNELASIFEKGEIVERNYERAAELYLQAAEQNDALAQRSLGVFYDFGLGVAQDAEQALKWYDMAAELGDSKAAFYAEQLRNKEASEADQ